MFQIRILISSNQIKQLKNIENTGCRDLILLIQQATYQRRFVKTKKKDSKNSSH
jgi:hypothetical protein